MNNDAEFDPTWQALIDAFNTGLVEPIKELIREYRCYYDINGTIIQVSDSNWNHPESGDYIVVDEHTYKNWIQFRVRNGQIEHKPTDPTTELQLIKSTSGYRVVKDNPALILEADEDFKRIEYYDNRNY